MLLHNRNRRIFAEHFDPFHMEFDRDRYIRYLQNWYEIATGVGIFCIQVTGETARFAGLS